MQIYNIEVAILRAFFIDPTITLKYDGGMTNRLLSQTL